MKRRDVLRTITAFGTLAVAGTPVFPASPLIRTPAQNEGPYYPLELPMIADSNLLKIGSGDPMAAGEPLGLFGRVLGRDGKPVSGALVEIWQSDLRGFYHHPYAPGREDVDPRFQGFGAAMTDQAGQYRFLTIVPAPYSFRTPHIHVKVRHPGGPELTTQLYLRDHPENQRDNLLKQLSASDRDRLMLDLKPTRLAGGLKGKAANYDLVV